MADRPRPLQKPPVVSSPSLFELVKQAEFMPPPVMIPIYIPKQLPPEPPMYQISIRSIQRTVCRVWKIGLIELLSHSRTPRCTVPRHVSFVLCKMLTLKSSTEIARACSDRDHSTAIHAFQKYQWLIDRLLLDMSPSDFLSEWVNRAYELVTERNG
jgi:predicted DNA-binding protein (MmcQ/YjbR family)